MKVNIRVNAVSLVPCSELSATVDNIGTCIPTCWADRGGKQQDPQGEAHELPKISILSDLIGS